MLAGIFENALRQGGRAFRNTLQSRSRPQWLNIVPHAVRLGACVVATLLQEHDAMSFPIRSDESDRHSLFQRGYLQIELLREFDGARKPDPCARRRDIPKPAQVVGGC